MTSGDPSIFEKKVRNSGLFQRPREVDMHRLAASAQNAANPFTIDLIEHRTGPLTTVLRMKHLSGKRGMPAPDALGPFIADLERQGRLSLGARQEPIPRHLDFFGSGGHRGPRYNLRTIVRRYRWSGGNVFPGFTEIAQACARSIAAHEHTLIAAPAVISHLDPFGMNFMQEQGRALLIDWGESFVGRPGFDAGGVLMVLFRRYDLQAFPVEASRFLHGYTSAALPMSRDDMLAAINRIFLPRSLWFLLLRKTVMLYEKRGQAQLWRDKIRYLAGCASGETWREMLDAE